MAKAPGHVLGEKIGWFFEEMIIDHYKKLLVDQEILVDQKIYVDFKHKRKARRNAKKVSRKDVYGNSHYLDIVIEKDGSEEKFGKPVGFIEVGWRRYTKHSKNKAQEIAGAILPIIDRYKDIAPFYGTVLAGDFTDNAIKQLISEGFCVIYFSTDTVFKAFSEENIDIRFEQDTSDDKLQEFCNAIDNMSQKKINKVRKFLMDRNEKEIEAFDKALLDSLNRKISSISVVALYGETKEFNNIPSACAYLSSIKPYEADRLDMVKIEIKISFNNEDSISMVFHEKQRAIIKLRELQNL